MCDHQRLRPVCAYAQSDRSICSSLTYSTTVKLLTEHNLERLSLTGGYTGLSESTLVKLPHCWKSHVTAHFEFEFNKNATKQSVLVIHFCLISTTYMYIEDIYLFEVNTKYNSSSAVKKISIFQECAARVKMLIFPQHEMKYIWYLPEKSKFSFYFILNGNTESTS